MTTTKTHMEAIVEVDARPVAALRRAWEGRHRMVFIISFHFHHHASSHSNAWRHNAHNSTTRLQYSLDARSTSGGGGSSSGGSSGAAAAAKSFCPPSLRATVHRNRQAR
jgi:hypothetical protein